jgi:hypothetical protein
MSEALNAPGTMSVVVFHDRDGRIVAVHAQPADAPVGSMTNIGDDHTSLQVHLPALNASLEPSEVARILVDIRVNHRVENGALVRSEASSEAR